MKHARVLLSCLLLLASGLLRAHTHLETAAPADGAVLKVAPSNLELNFGEEVQLLKLGIVSAAGDEQAMDFKPSAAASKAFVIPMPAFAPSAYTVNWTVLGADGHRVEGHFSFTVDPNATESAGAAAEHHDH